MTKSLRALTRQPLAGGRLTIIAGPEHGRDIVWRSRELTIGTDPTADVTLCDPTVSRFHCVLRNEPDGLSIHDLDSRNGTFVGGYRVASAYLHPDAIIGLGRTHLRFASLEASAPERAADRFGSIIGASEPMRRLFERLEQVAPSNATVLLTGETGTGKDIVAEAIHDASHRRAGPFVVFDCGRIAPSLLEAELFGHERGSFTGAEETRIGVIESAHGGTLFLDEIGELSVDLQPKLLRLLERQQVCRIGSTQTRTVNVRIVAATNRNLADMVAAGTFRSDLFYRLDVVHLTLPPLRERGEDICLLANAFAEQISGDCNASIPPELRSVFLSHDWPGNVRELRTAVERWMLLGAKHRLINEPIRALGSENEMTAKPNMDLDVAFRDAKARIVSDWEEQYLRNLLRIHHGNVSRAARAVKMSRNYLTELLHKHNLSAKDS